MTNHHLKICIDTVKNPLKGEFLGGPTAEQAEKILREEYGWSGLRIHGLKLHGEGERRRNAKRPSNFYAADGTPLYKPGSIL